MPHPIWNALLVPIANFRVQAEDPGAAPGAPTPANPAPNFQPYVFWAYGIACTLILLFTLWTLWQARKVRRKLDVLEERFERAHPGQN